MTDILLHFKTGKHGYLSNFYSPPRPILLDGKEWETSEHYYQAQKFVTTDPLWAEAIRTAQGPYAAWRMAKDPAHARRLDWKTVKDDVMRSAIHAKFVQNPQAACSHEAGEA